MTDIILIYYDLLLQRGYKYNDLYDMTLKELANSLKQVNKGLGYMMWRQASLNGATFSKQFPKKPEEASPELYPPKKTYQMPNWVKDRYYKQKGVK